MSFPVQRKWAYLFLYIFLPYLFCVMKFFVTHQGNLILLKIVRVIEKNTNFTYVVWIWTSERLYIIWSITTIFCCKYFIRLISVYTFDGIFFRFFNKFGSLCHQYILTQQQVCWKPHCYIFGNKIFSSMFMSKFFSKVWWDLTKF